MQSRHCALCMPDCVALFLIHRSCLFSLLPSSVSFFFILSQYSSFLFLLLRSSPQPFLNVYGVVVARLRTMGHTISISTFGWWCLCASGAAMWGSTIRFATTIPVIIGLCACMVCNHTGFQRLAVSAVHDGSWFPVSVLENRSTLFYMCHSVIAQCTCLVVSQCFLSIGLASSSSFLPRFPSSSFSAIILLSSSFSFALHHNHSSMCMV